MPSRFGIKDAILLAAVLFLTATVWLRMVQGDREWRQSRRLEQQLTEATRSAAEQARALDERLAALTREVSALRAAGGVTGDGGGPTPDQPPAAPPSSDDDTWARPGVPIERWPAPAFATDPRVQPGFREGGEFTEVFPARVARLTPYIFTDTYARRISELVLESLGDYDPRTLRLRGVLAEAWQIDPEGLWLRARLRAGARFSDGSPVTADDVRWTFHEYAMNPQIDAARSRAVLECIERVEALAPRVVEFRFKAPLFFNIPAALTMQVLPRAFYEKFTPAQLNQSTGLLMGSGPFRLADLEPGAQWTPGKDVVLARNDRHAGPRPAIDRVRFRVVTDETARLVAYRNGEADMIEPSAPQFERATAEPGWAEANRSLKWINMRSGPQFIAWQCGRRGGSPEGPLTPFADARVRIAMTCALDRERIIRDIYGGVGVPAHGYFNPASPASDRTITPWRFDMDRARALLKEAGWEDRDGDGVLENQRGEPFAFEFTRAAGGEVAERLAAYVRDQCAKLGIRCTVRVLDWAALQQAMKARDFDAVTLGSSASAPETDPKQLWHSSSIPAGGDNFTQWASPRADAAIDRGRRTMDFAARMACWHELERAIHEEQPMTWLRSTESVRFVRARVGNVVAYPKGLEVAEFFLRASGGEGAPSKGLD